MNRVYTIIPGSGIPEREPVKDPTDGATQNRARIIFTGIIIMIMTGLTGLMEFKIILFFPQTRAMSRPTILEMTR